MGSARRLLLLAALALAIATDARTDATLSTLTLSPDAGSLISTRDGATTTSTTDTSSGVIGSAASDNNKVTETPATETPATTAPTTSDSGSTSSSGSDEQETTDAPSSATATVSPGSTSDRSNTETQSETAATSSASSTASSKSTASVDTLNDSNGAINSGGSTNSMGTILPVVFGALACVGAIVMAVTYKKKRDSNYAREDNRPSSDCEYAIGADFTPDNRALSTVQEDTPPVAVKVPAQSSADYSASASIADFTGTNSSVSSLSPFGSARCKVRVSSPVQNCFSSSEPNMEFQDTAPRHDGGSNVVLTIDTDASQTGPQVQL